MSCIGGGLGPIQGPWKLLGQGCSKFILPHFRYSFNKESDSVTILKFSADQQCKVSQNFFNTPKNQHVCLGKYIPILNHPHQILNVCGCADEC